MRIGLCASRERYSIARKKYHYRYYSCKTYKHTHELEKCGNKIWRADKLEEIIIDRVKNYSFATRNVDKEDELDSINAKLKVEHLKKKGYSIYI